MGKKCVGKAARIMERLCGREVSLEKRLTKDAESCYNMGVDVFYNDKMVERTEGNYAESCC